MNTKRIKGLLIATLLLLGTTSIGFAQSQHVKVIALLNKASWCPVCKANGPRFMKDIAPMVMKNKEVKMVVYNLSNAKTRAKSGKKLKKAGIYHFAIRHDATGAIYFLDANSKKLLSRVNLAESNKKIKKAYKQALSKAKG